MIRVELVCVSHQQGGIAALRIDYERKCCTMSGDINVEAPSEPLWHSTIDECLQLKPVERLFDFLLGGPVVRSRWYWQETRANDFVDVGGRYVATGRRGEPIVKRFRVKLRPLQRTDVRIRCNADNNASIVN